jgi:hypothetical protein
MTLAEGIMDSTVSLIFDHVTSWQIIVFAVSWVLALLYLLAVLKPFLSRNRHEVDRMADMLSQLPPDMDVELLVEQALYPKRGAHPCSPASSIVPARVRHHAHGVQLRAESCHAHATARCRHDVISHAVGTQGTAAAVPR